MIENLAKKHGAQCGWSGDRYIVRFQRGTFYKAAIFNNECLDLGYRLQWTRQNNAWFAEVFRDEF